MKPLDAIVIFAGEHGWWVGSSSGVDELQFDADATAADVASAVGANLRGRGYRGEGVLLALPSAWCLAARIRTDDLPPDDRGTRAFRLEEKLPVAAENFTADFVEGDGAALGVCVANDRLAPLVGALEGQGVLIQSISPAVMLAIQGVAREQDGQAVLWGEGDRVNVVTLWAGGPVSWALIDPTPAALRLQLATVASGAQDLRAFDVQPDLAAGASTESLSLHPVVTDVAAGMLSGHVRPWFELRRGAMAADDCLRVVRRAVNAALVAAAVFCVAVSAVFLFRAARYDALARAYDEQATTAFRQHFPGWPVPANVRAVVESERRRLSLAGGSSLPAGARSSALRVMREVLSGVPPDGRVAVDRMAFHDGGLELEGRALANGDVDVLVAAARSTGLDVPPPQLRKTADNTWSFVVRATRPHDPGTGATAGGTE